MHWRAIVSVLFIAALALAGCTTPPRAERTEAEDAVNAARAAGAEQYAPGEFALAIGALRAAAAQMDARKYREAKALLRTDPIAQRHRGPGGREGKGDAEGRRGAAADRGGTALAGPRGPAQGHGVDRRIVIETLQLVRSLAGDDPEVARDRLTAVTTMLDQWEAELKVPRAPTKKL